jgi:hypothetical protein
LLPLVEKAAEHLTAIDEAWDGQMVIMLAPSIATWAYFCIRTSRFSTVLAPPSRPHYSMLL